MQNTNFINYLNKANITPYMLAKKTGVPYTTINELTNGKISINKCAAETVQKIAIELNTTSEKLLNEIHYMNGVKGKYRGLHYQWKQCEDGDMMIILNYKDQLLPLKADGKYVLETVTNFV